MHKYKQTEIAEWSDTFTCQKCGMVRSYAAEDMVSAEWLSEADTAPCLPAESLDGANQPRAARDEA